MLTTAGTIVAWVLYVFSGNIGWVPMGTHSKFETRAQCQEKLNERAMAMSALGIKSSQMNMRCEREGWSGKRIPEIDL